MMPIREKMYVDTSGEAYRRRFHRRRQVAPDNITVRGSVQHVLGYRGGGGCMVSHSAPIESRIGSDAPYQCLILPNESPSRPAEEKYPDKDQAHGIAFTGLSDARPETKAPAERPRKLDHLPFNYR